MLLVGLATALVSGVTASRFTGTVLAPAGDEPHYLVIAQSLWRDGDFRIENNHQRGDYREYFPRELDPHYLTRGSDGEIYSIHPVGLPILLAPIYAAGGYQLVVLTLMAMAAAAAALMWRWVAVTLGAPGAATFAWAAVALSAPFLFNPFTAYPEIAAALAVMVALTAHTPLVAGLPWLSTAYAPMSAVLLASRCGTDPRPRRAGGRPASARRALRRLAAGVVRVLHAFGVPCAAGAAWGDGPDSPWNSAFGAPGPC